MILVTGATGNNGAEIIKRLTGSGRRIRALVRKPPQATDTLPDIEYVAADFDDPRVSAQRWKAFTELFSRRIQPNASRRSS